MRGGELCWAWGQSPPALGFSACAPGVPAGPCSVWVPSSTSRVSVLRKAWPLINALDWQGLPAAPHAPAPLSAAAISSGGDPGRPQTPNIGTFQLGGGAWICGWWRSGRGLDLGKTVGRGVLAGGMATLRAGGPPNPPGSRLRGSAYGALLPPGGKTRACTLRASPVGDAGAFYAPGRRSSSAAADSELLGTLKPIRWRLVGRGGVEELLPTLQSPAELSFRAQRGSLPSAQYLWCGATCAAPGALRQADHPQSAPLLDSWGDGLERPLPVGILSCSPWAAPAASQSLSWDLGTAWGKGWSAAGARILAGSRTNTKQF